MMGILWLVIGAFMLVTRCEFTFPYLRMHYKSGPEWNWIGAALIVIGVLVLKHGYSLGL
jgi:hypothetical protein